MPHFHLDSALVKFDKDLVFVGAATKYNGFSSWDALSSKIYKLECVNGHYHLQLMTVKLRTQREEIVASIIPTNFGDLN